MSKKEQKYYDRIKSNLIGQKIIEVYYEELKYDDQLTLWQYSNDIHSVDMNIIFQFESGKIIQIKWDNEFYPYGVGFETLKKINKKEEVNIVRVTKNSNWKKLIGKEISKITVLWDISKTATTKKANNQIIETSNTVIRLPQSWEINFNDSIIWISTLEIIKDEINSFWADHLSIFFTEKVQEKYQLVEKSNMQHSI